MDDDLRGDSDDYWTTMNTNRLNLGVVRTICLGMMLLAAMAILLWMYTEQNKIEGFTQVHKVALAASQSANQQPQIQVVVQMPKENKTEKKISWDYYWDKMSYRSEAELKQSSTRTIILVRHGQYDLATGHLTEKGRQQANYTGKRLADLNMPYDAMIHSTMDRAVETAMIIKRHLGNIPVSSDDMLIEGGPYKPTPTITYWSLPDRAYHVDGPRMESAFRKYFHRADPQQRQQSFHIVVGHANIFRFFALRALQLEPSAWMRIFIAHASISVIHVNPDSTVTLTKLGDSGHFPPKFVTF